MKTIIIIFILTLTVKSMSGQDISDQLLKARALVSQGKPEQAIRGLTEAIQTVKDYRLYIERAEAGMITGDYSGAISDLNEADKLTPSSAEYGLARVYALKGDVSTALYHLELNLNSPFRKNEKTIMLDKAFASIENKPEWRLFWKKERYTELERKVSEIEFYASSGRTDEAKGILTELKKLYPGNSEVIYSEALTYLSSLKYSEAISMISPLIQEEPRNEKYLRILVKAQEGSSNPAGASSTYSALLESGVADATLLLSRAECYRKTGEIDKALIDLEKYLGYYPDDKKALSLDGKTQAMAGDNLKAIELFSKNLELHPGDADCYIDRGNSYLISKSWKWAISDYSMSLDLKPDNPEAWLNKGIALLNSGQLNDACHDFGKAMRLGNKRASEYINKNCIK